MVRIFGEDVDNHPLDADLRSYVAVPPPSPDECLSQSVCLNIREDTWVPAASRENFLQFRLARGDKDLEYCLTAYHRVRVRTDGEFIGYAERLEAKNPAELLVRVFNLSGVFDPLDRFLRSREFRAWPSEARKIFRASSGDPVGYPDFPNDPVGYSDWLSSRMKSQDFERNLDIILSALTIQGGKLPYRPCWVTLLSDFRKRIAGAPDCWRVVGIKPPQTGDWLVLLAHRYDDISPLFRPCQLFAGWYGLHYPAPKGAHSGYAMEILCKDPTARPLEEYITAEIAPRLDHWKAAGEIRPWQVGVTTYSVDDHLNDRRIHSLRLANVL
jgi:hypothetical protein